MRLYDAPSEFRKDSMETVTIGKTHSTLLLLIPGASNPSDTSLHYSLLHSSVAASNLKDIVLVCCNLQATGLLQKLYSYYLTVYVNYVN